MTHATKPARLPAAQRPPLARMPALVIPVYSVAAYLLFVAVLGYAAGFFAGFGVPAGIDQGPRRARWLDRRVARTPPGQAPTGPATAPPAAHNEGQCPRAWVISPETAPAANHTHTDP